MVTRPTLAWLLNLMAYASSALINKLFRAGALAREQGGRDRDLDLDKFCWKCILQFPENYAVMIRTCFLDGNF
jgi:hypothetical protein